MIIGISAKLWKNKKKAKVVKFIRRLSGIITKQKANKIDVGFNLTGAEGIEKALHTEQFPKIFFYTPKNQLHPKQVEWVRLYYRNKETEMLLIVLNSLTKSSLVDVAMVFTKTGDAKVLSDLTKLGKEYFKEPIETTIEFEYLANLFNVFKTKTSDKECLFSNI